MNTTNPNYTEEQEKIAIQSYVEEGKGQIPSAKAAGITVKQLKQILMENGYKIRTRHEAIILQNQNRNLLISHDYLKNQSSNMAWFLGFFAADGSIEKDRNVMKLSLNTQDKEILEKIRLELNLKAEVKDYTDSLGHPISKLQWSSEEMKNDFATYGIIPQKTFNLKPPYKLEKKYWIDYIRGYFDGDGSVTLLKNNYNSLEFEITAATPTVLTFIRDWLFKEYNIPKVNIHEFVQKGKDHPLYLLLYSTNATKQIYNCLYYENCLTIRRKYEKYTSLIAQTKK